MAAGPQRRDLWDNPMGTDGFEFVEYTGPDPHALAALFERMGFVAAARHLLTGHCPTAVPDGSVGW